MKTLNAVYHHINILSLDVAAGAVICALFFARIFQVSVSLAALTALCLTVWIVYTIDHLRDATSISKAACTDRHRFHQKYFKAVSITLLVIMVLDFVVIWFLPRRMLMLGLMLWIVVLGYLVLQRYLKFLKEFFVACLYTAGILLPSLALITEDLQTVHYILTGKFFITALMNLLLFSLFDYKEDRNQQQHSFVTWFGPASTRKGILLLGLINILSGIRLWSFDPGVAIIFISMNIMLLMILFFQRPLRSNNYYRKLGDAVFFIPLFYLL